MENKPTIGDAIKHLDKLVKNQHRKIESLIFKIIRNGYKLENKQPDFSGMLTIPENIILKKGSALTYAGWIDDAGNINLKISHVNNSTNQIKVGFKSKMNNK